MLIIIDISHYSVVFINNTTLVSHKACYYKFVVKMI